MIANEILLYNFFVSNHDQHIILMTIPNRASSVLAGNLIRQRKLHNNYKFAIKFLNISNIPVCARD